MAQPVHHDVEKFEAQCRATMAKISADGAAAVARGDADQSFVTAQDQFVEARVQFATAQLKCTNLGCADDDVVSAAALAMGTMYGSLMAACNGDIILLQTLSDSFATAVEDTQRMLTREGQQVHIVQSTPTRGGHA